MFICHIRAFGEGRKYKEKKILLISVLPGLERALEFLFLTYNSAHDKICICPVIDKCITISGTGKT
jgi:hypothetical protein